VALLAHEVAHDVNGDFSRTFFVGSAIDSLVNWYLLLAPDRGPTRYQGSAIAGLGDIVGRMVMSVIAELILTFVFFMDQLLLFERRRAEYLADDLSARVAGTDAAVSMLEILKGRGRSYIPLQHRTHPPIEYRIEFLKDRPTMLPEMALSTATSEQIERELAALEGEMRRRVEQRRNEGRYY
jgi:Zn-dependent protease with chaperone function